MKKIILLYVFLTVLFMLAQIDDDLNADAREFLARLASDTSSEAYFYLAGISSAQQDDPATVGRNLLAEYRKSEQDESYEIIEYPQNKLLALPEGELFCKERDRGCLASLFTSNTAIEGLLNTHQVLISRAQKFHGFTEFRTLTMPSMSEAILPFRYLAAAERLMVLQSIAVYKNGDPEKAINSLLFQFAEIRKSLASQDSFFGKLVLLQKLSEILDVASVILSEHGAKIKPLYQLSDAEKSVRDAVAREFAMYYDTFNKLDKDPEFFKSGGNMPGWITRLVYKPNMTLNALAPRFKHLEHLALQPPVEFIETMKATPSNNSYLANLRNLRGQRMLAYAPELTDYVARFFDFDAKLMLFNHLYSGEPADFENPYYAGESFEEDKGHLCFTGPLENKWSLRCLLVRPGQ